MCKAMGKSQNPSSILQQCLYKVEGIDTDIYIGEEVEYFQISIYSNNTYLYKYKIFQFSYRLLPILSYTNPTSYDYRYS